MLPIKYERVNKTQTKLSDWISSISSFIFVSSIPPVHIFVLWYYWSDYTNVVDKVSCSCSCWDTVFKGPYESGIASYKHFYFNATQNMMKVWFIVVSYLIILHECVRWLINLWLSANLRIFMAVLFFSSLFSHYYSWWVYVNYYNDEFYVQWYHQLFFTATEMVSTIAVLWLCTKEHHLSPNLMRLIILISVVHVFAAMNDQFVANVIRGEGMAHQVVRDIGLMVPDILHITIPFLYLRGSKC